MKPLNVSLLYVAVDLLRIQYFSSVLRCPDEKPSINSTATACREWIFQSSFSNLDIILAVLDDYQVVEHQLIGYVDQSDPCMQTNLLHCDLLRVLHRSQIAQQTGSPVTSVGQYSEIGERMLGVSNTVLIT